VRPLTDHLSGMRNCLTVDVEEWFHVCGVDGALAPDRWDELPSRVVTNTRDLLDLLERCDVRATFFVLGWVATRHPRLVEQIAEAGHEIGSHGHSHRRVYELSPERFAEELDQSRAALRAAGAETVIGFRAPEWSINDRSLWALDVLARKGFRFDSSMAPLRIVGNPRYSQEPHTLATSAGELVEFPPLVGRRFGQNVPLGGGWGLRMANPDRVVAAIEDRNRNGTPVALFVHPWEIDPDPPRVRLPRAKRFVHYFRLAGFPGRLEQVLRGVTFAPMGQVLGLSPVAG
jgi:polysaccharide deacetylase family protein (PEP-CTERM system associated)